VDVIIRRRLRAPTLRGPCDPRSLPAPAQP
jgi:hypothetical protein